MRIKWFSFVRITGLIFVLTYHFFENKFSGGFIGVDIFFTFSGFLITALMVDEFAKKDSFNLVAFYKRRLYRIFPPLLLMVFVSLPLTYLISPDFITNLGKQVAAALGFTTNFFEIATGGSYEAQFIPHLFVHTWSLAVEMHYYLVWGLVAFLLALLVDKLTTNQGRRVPIFRGLLLITSFIFFVISFIAMIVGARGLKDFSPVYFSSITHSFPFFIGSMVGLQSGIGHPTKKFIRKMASWSRNKAIGVLAGSFVLLLVLGFTLKFDQSLTYWIGFFLTSVLASAMIYAARILHEKTTVSEPKVITFLADVSYGMYLFHWPLYIVFSHLVKPGVTAAVYTTALSMLFAAISYYVIEPLLAGKTIQPFHLELSTKMKAVWIPLVVVGAILLGTTVGTVAKAPRISSLETQLWVGSLYQDVNGLSQTRQLVDAMPATEYNVPKGVTIIGDSVTLGTSKYLGENVADSAIDAEGNRTMDLAYKIVKEQQDKNILREYVVICIGTNALDDYKEQTMNIINYLGAGHRLIFMTPHDGNATADDNSVLLGIWEQDLPAQYNYITIADWNKVAIAHPEVFKGTDGTHFAGRVKGDELYAKCVNDALKVSAERPAKTTEEAAKKATK